MTARVDGTRVRRGLIRRSAVGCAAALLVLVAFAGPALGNQDDTFEIDFGQQKVDTTGPWHPITLENAHFEPDLKVSQVRADGDYVVENLCPPAVPPGGRCEIDVAFAPRSTGTRAGRLWIYENRASSPVSGVLSGEGVTSAPEPAPSPTPGPVASPPPTPAASPTPVQPPPVTSSTPPTAAPSPAPAPTSVSGPATRPRPHVQPTQTGAESPSAPVTIGTGARGTAHTPAAQPAPPVASPPAPAPPSSPAPAADPSLPVVTATPDEAATGTMPPHTPAAAPLGAVSPAPGGPNQPLSLVVVLAGLSGVSGGGLVIRRRRRR